MAINLGELGCGGIWMQIVQACCHLCLRMAWAFNAMLIMRWMCQCILCTATENTLTRWASRSAIF